MLVAHGTYTGDGNNDRDITGVGFDPHLVLIHGSGSGSGAWRSASHTGDDSCSWASDVANAADKIQAFITDGFQVGTDAAVNTNGTTYYYLAFRDNGDSDFAYGTYTGDGNDDRSITGLGFDPNFVQVTGGAGNQAPIFRTSSHTGDSSYGYIDNISTAANRIQAFVTGGFQIGTSSYVNSNNNTYYYFAFKEVSGEFDVGVYTGDGNDNRDITGLGFDPVIVVSKEASTSNGVFRTGDHVGDSSLIGAGSNATNRIQDFITDGFEVGSSTAINDNGIEYTYTAWKLVAAAGGTRPLPQRVLSGPFAGPLGGPL